MSSSNRTTSLFDDIFQLQSTVPDIDPEDSEDGTGFKSAALTEGANEVEAFGSTQLRKQAAIIPDDPKYRGKKTSRKTLYSDDEPEESELSDVDEEDQSHGNEFYKDGETDDDEEDESDDDDDGADEEEDDMEANDDDEDLGNAELDTGNKKDAVVLAPSDTNDFEKGKAVSFQLGVWDDLIKCRISLQKMIASCNSLPMPDLWGSFASFPQFQKESKEAHKSMRRILLSLLELEQQLIDKQPKDEGKRKLEGGDEEITSESEVEDDDTKTSKDKGRVADNNESMNEDVDEENDDEIDEEEEDSMETDEGEMDDAEEEEADGEKKDASSYKADKGTSKRKLTDATIEQAISKRHKKFQSFRNNTLEKWDEKTRLSHAKIKSKNFAAFDISVLKQIQQVLGNKERLVRRIHQNRSAVRILGQVETEDDKLPKEVVLEDDEDEVEVKQRAVRPELDVNYEIVDDSDFYQMCLRDFIQLKQNEETDPVLANKHWLEIQNMRKKHKRKVDTRASKGRKIRYHVKEKLKNFMAPYDKSMWSDEQKDDLFKALFGGQQVPEDNHNVPHNLKEENEPLTIDIGL